MRRRRKAPQPVPPAAARGPVTRRRKLAELEPPPVDRISALPDELLGDIILLLPAKDGARTQALASRWRRLWRSVPLNLDFCELVSHNNGYSLPAQLLLSVLSAHPGPVRRLCARAVNAVEYDWLRSAVLDNLEELEFVSLVPNPPASIFRFSATLRVASIAGCEIPDGLRFPRLTHLGLQRVHVLETSLHGLIAGCPDLEFLMVHRGYGFRCLRINSLTLRSVSVRFYKPNESAPELQFSQLIVEKAPSLERLVHVYAHWGMHVFVLSAPKVATLGFLAEWQNICTRLVSASIRGLRVDSPAAAVHTVKSISIDMKILSLDSIVDLMKLFPCLEKLHVKSEVSSETNCWRRKHLKFIKSHDIRLKTLVLEPYLGNPSHVNFATFFVLNATTLELMRFLIDATVYSDKFLGQQYSKLQLEYKASRGARFDFARSACQHADWSTKHLRDFDLNDSFLDGC